MNDERKSWTWTKKEIDLLKKLYKKVPVKEIAERLGRTEKAIYSAVQRRKLGKHTIQKRAKPTRKYNETLCWQCKTPIKQCCWLSNAVPVAGWTASESVIVGNSDRCKNSYKVLECPIYSD